MHDSLSYIRSVQEVGVLFTGADPTSFDIADPLRLWMIQIVTIMVTTQLLSAPLRMMGQPRVIAEITGGIILGPSALGRIPGFTQHIFPEQSLPLLSLTANVGLVLFLFLVGLNFNVGVIKINTKKSFLIATAGTVIPFGVGAAFSIPLYKQFVDESTSYVTFLLITSVAFSITAFPVLCRFIVQMNIVNEPLGITALSTGLLNAIIGWVLLALSVAFVNDSTRSITGWILLAAVAWVSILLLPFRYGLSWLAYYSGSIDNGPTILFTTVISVVIFSSAFVTDVIGVHANLGGFLAGIIIPRKNNLTERLTEKFEHMVSIVLLPLYFTLSGLSTDFGLLNTGTIWAYTIALCMLAFISKFGSCLATSKLVGSSWREATTVGALMTCKGLVELIVLNTGLSAGILSKTVFSMFVLEALSLTFVVSPILSLLRSTDDPSRAKESGPPFEEGNGTRPIGSLSKEEPDALKSGFAFILDKLEHMPAILSSADLLLPPHAATITHGGRGVHFSDETPVQVIRLVESADCNLGLMRVPSSVASGGMDPLLSVFLRLVKPKHEAFSCTTIAATGVELASKIIEYTRSTASGCIVLPWALPNLGAKDREAIPLPKTSLTNPFETLFKTPTKDTPMPTFRTQFIRTIFEQSHSNVAVYIERATTDSIPTAIDNYGIDHTGRHLLVPFFGGPDDRLSLQLVMHMCSDATISATVVKIMKVAVGASTKSDNDVHSTDQTVTVSDRGNDENTELREASDQAEGTYSRTSDTRSIISEVSSSVTVQNIDQSGVLDNIAWSYFKLQTSTSSNIVLLELASTSSIHTVIEDIAAKISGGLPNITVVLGRTARCDPSSIRLESCNEAIDGGGHGELKETVGDIANALVLSGCNRPLMIVQAAPS